MVEKEQHTSEMDLCSRS